MGITAHRLQKGLSRKAFLAYMAGAMVGGMAALLGIPGAVFVIGPSQRRFVGAWVPVGEVGQFSAGPPKLVTTTVSRQRGWVIEEQELSVFISTVDGREYMALSDRCTHLECRVRYVEETSAESPSPGFYCPCHDGFFDLNGGVVAGPPPRPLDRFETMVENGHVLVKEL